MEQGVLRELEGRGRNPATETDFALNLTIVYEDAATHDWAGEVCQRVARLVGGDAVRRTWWKLGDFTEPAVLAGAVSTALRADVLVIAIRATEALSLPFYIWVRSWLPHRPSRLAALVALVALPTRPSLASDRAQDYLRAIAREANLDFLLEERKLAGGQVSDAPKTLRLPSPKKTTAARARLRHVRPWCAQLDSFKTSAAA